MLRRKFGPDRLTRRQLLAAGCQATRGVLCSQAGRAVLSLGAGIGRGLAAAVAAAEAPPPADWRPRDLVLREIRLEGDFDLARRMLLLVPRHAHPDERFPLLVLLHGLAETRDERLGIYAWVERYGLGTAYDRLRRPPVVPLSRRRDWPLDRLAQINADLARRSFGGMVLACPFTPNLPRTANPWHNLDRYARWIVEVVVPRARREAPVGGGVAATALDGCSLGGYLALEVFLRRPEAFGACGTVQGAFGTRQAVAYGRRLRAVIDRVGPRDLHIETSDRDAFKAGNLRLAAELERLQVPHSVRVLPGPHDQPWLRESGSLEMLLWHDRRIRPRP